MRSGFFGQLFWDLPDAQDENVWHVAAKDLPRGYFGGGLFFEIAAHDGRLIDLMMTQ